MCAQKKKFQICKHSNPLIASSWADSTDVFNECIVIGRPKEHITVDSTSFNNRQAKSSPWLFARRISVGKRSFGSPNLMIFPLERISIKFNNWIFKLERIKCLSGGEKHSKTEHLAGFSFHTFPESSSIVKTQAERERSLHPPEGRKSSTSENFLLLFRLLFCPAKRLISKSFVRFSSRDEDENEKPQIYCV